MKSKLVNPRTLGVLFFGVVGLGSVGCTPSVQTQNHRAAASAPPPASSPGGYKGYAVPPVGSVHSARGFFLKHLGASKRASDELRLAHLHTSSSEFLLTSRFELELTLNPEQAESDLVRACQSQPDAVSLHGLLARRHLQRGRHEQAVQEFERSHIREATRSEDWADYVDALLWTGRTDDARNFAQSTGVDEPHSRDVREMAYRFEDHGAYSEGAAIVEKIAALSPNDTSLVLDVARQREALGEFERVAEMLEEAAHSEDSMRPDILSQAAQLWFQSNPRRAEDLQFQARSELLNEPDLAEFVLQSELEWHASGVVVDAFMTLDGARDYRGSLHLRLAVLLMLEGRNAECSALLSRYNTFDAHLQRARCQKGYARTRSLRRAAALLSERWTDWSRLAHVVSEDSRHLTQASRRFNRLRPFVDKSLKASVGWDVGDLSLSDYFGDTSRVAQKISSLKGRGTWRASSALRLVGAVIGHRHGLESYSRKVLDDLRTSEPLNPHVLNVSAYLALRQGGPLAVAGIWLRRAHRLAPRDPYIADSLGWYYWKAGNPLMAERYLRRALAGLPDDPEVLAHLAEVLREKGDNSWRGLIRRVRLVGAPRWLTLPAPASGAAS